MFRSYTQFQLGKHTYTSASYTDSNKNTHRTILTHQTDAICVCICIISIGFDRIVAIECVCVLFGIGIERSVTESVGNYTK